MRNLYDEAVNVYRETGRHVLENFGNVGDGTCGVFNVPSPIDQSILHIVASAGEGWDHVSVSRPNRCPNWPEMHYVRGLFFDPHEVAMQLHPTEAEHISLHPYCMHIWRPNDGRAIPLPPTFMV